MSRSALNTAPSEPCLIDVRIKWPNDVYAGGKKLGGVLCGSSFASGSFLVTVGVGLNVSNDAPTTCVDTLIAAAAAAVGRAPPPRVTRETLLASFLTRFEALEGVFSAAGFAPLQPAYLAAWLHTGQVVSVEEEEEGVSGGDGGAPPRRQVTITGLAPSGYLRGVDALGVACELHPDGNSLDWFRGA